MGDEFRIKLEQLLNQWSKENESNTPDFILANYLINCLAAFDSAVREREIWYGRPLTIGTEATDDHDTR